MHYVYILYSESRDRYYTESTADLGRRINEHNKGSQKATRHMRPLELVWFAEKPDNLEARRLERKLKNITSRAALVKFIDKYSVDPELLDSFLTESSGCGLADLDSD